VTDEKKGDAAARPGSLFRTLKMVAWSFVGIRKNSEYKEDLARVNPLHVIAVAIVAVLVFVVGLVFLVHWVVGK
jgi:amino acid transporter